MVFTECMVYAKEVLAAPSETEHHSSLLKKNHMPSVCMVQESGPRRNKNFEPSCLSGLPEAVPDGKIDALRQEADGDDDDL